MMNQVVPVSIASIDYASAEVEVESFNEIPLTAMSRNTRRQLSGLLNRRKYLRSEGGYYRDWRGIAQLTQDRNFFDESAISGRDPTSVVIDGWCRYSPRQPTFANLQMYLGLIDRWDASDDILENLVVDARTYRANQSKNETQIVRQPSEEECAYDILTDDDSGQSPQFYDAFVLYADIDAKYAAEIRSRLEEQSKNNIRLCFKDKLLAGQSFVHVALTKVIEERCRRVIVIYTKEFCKSPEDEFLVNYTHAFQIQNRKRKIIPLIYDDEVVLPAPLRIVIPLKYNAFNYWERLAASILPPPFEASITVDNNLSQNNRNSDVPSEQPLPLMEIPSINIIPARDDDAVSAIKETGNFKKNKPNRNVGNNHVANGNVHYHNNESISSKILGSKGFMLRHAHSTSQLNGKNYKENNLSSSDVSISSNCSDTLKKKKKRWPSKFLKRVFSRSSNKLHTAV